MKKKLLHLASDTFKGGAESVFRNTIEATLESKKFEIYVASCDDPPPCNIADTHFLHLDDWQLYPKWRGAYKYIFNLTNYKRLKTFLFATKPEIIHTQNYLSRLSPSILFALRAYKAKYPQVKLIYTQHGFGPCANGGFYNYAKAQICEKCIGHSKLRIAYENCDRRGRIHSLLKALRSPFYQGVFLQEKELFDTIICVGEFQRSKHIQDGWDSNKLITLTNPIETRFYNPHTSLDDKQNLIIFFGRLSPEKNVPLLIHAFANLLKIPRFSHYQLLIIGDGDDKPKCLELAQRLIKHSNTRLDSILDSAQNLQPKSNLAQISLPYTFLPARSPQEIAAILTKAKLSILPSLWYETFGLTIIESILAGAIPIVSDLGAMQETVARFYGKSFSFDPNIATKENNIQSLEVCIINTLDSYESEFATLLDKREEIIQNLHSHHYLNKLIKLYLYGGGGIITIELSLLMLCAFAHHLQAPIQFIKALSPQELKWILTKAKLSISPSLLNETFGLTIVESMLCGTPALVANRPELNTTAQRFGGFVFDDLQKSLCEVLDEYDKYFSYFLKKREKSATYILSHPYPKELHNLYEYSNL